METRKDGASSYGKSLDLRLVSVRGTTAHAPGSRGLSREFVGFWKNWEEAHDGTGSGEQKKAPAKAKVPMQTTGLFRFTVQRHVAVTVHVQV